MTERHPSDGDAGDRDDRLFDGIDGGPPSADEDPFPRDDDGAGDPGSTRWGELADDGGAASAPGARAGEDGVPLPRPGEPATGGRAGASSRGSGSGSFLRELPVLLLIALVLAFLLRTFVIQVFYIPSSSMEPTLSVNDRMVVEKITYLFRDPVRGEIVVFEGEELGEIDPDTTAGERFVRVVGQFLGVVPASARDFVKRVIGLPGDVIRIEEGVVYVNDVALDEPYVAFEDPSDFGPVTVPDDALFFLGDNRPNSSDSRRGLGFVPLDKVVGRSAAIIWPVDHATLLTDVEHELAGTSEHELAGTSGHELAGTSGHELAGTSGHELAGTSEHELAGTSEHELAGMSPSGRP